MTAADGGRPSFGDRLAAAMGAHGQLCVGIDPHPELLERWGLADDAAGLREFALRCVAAFGGHVAAIKPQSAFFERHGAAGIAVLEEVLAAARAAETLTILDVKRGDIGSTMRGYAEAYLRPDAPLVTDAITLSPFLGAESLQPATDLALDHGRGVFILALTSNAEGAGVQHARGSDSRSVAQAVVDYAARHNAGTTLGSVGLVVGATIGGAPADLGIDLAASRAPLLAPGVGAQGAGPPELRAVFGSARSAVLASSSRGVLRAGPDVEDLRRAAQTASREATTALRAQ
ncbi:MAG TPA: orotidine-5'-phosphate decarboxylase [Actinomycetaceae bacterium]|nr:orotidine-5'-phosphate decarboxylase [Actinomycetaceae bacterium]